MKKDDDAKTNRLHISIVATDDGDRMATLFQFESKRILIDNDDFVDRIQRTTKRLQDLIGAVITSTEYTKIKERSGSADLDESVLGITRPGFEQVATGCPRYFALPNGSVIKQPTLALTLIPMFEKNPTASCRGDFETYVRELGPLIRDQPIAITVFFFALTPILQPFVKGIMNVENVIMELVGTTSTSKSTLTNQLAGSVWGGSGSKLGYAASWNATPNAVEDMCRTYNNCLLVLDEATAAGPTARSRADNILNTAHRISLGRSKARFGDADPISYDLMALSNSNEPLTDILNSSGAVSGAAEVRILTFNCAHPEFGYLHPREDSDGVRSPIGPQLRDLCTTHYGHVAHRFIFFVLAECAKDPEGFKRQIIRHMQRFLDHFGAAADNERALRQAKPFALTYACAKLAKDYLITDDSWGKTGLSISRCYRQFITQGQRSGKSPEIWQFLSDRSKTIIDCVSNPKRVLTDKEFKAIDGFIVDVKGKRRLAISPTSFKRNFPDSGKLAAELAGSNMLIRTEGNQFKKSVRLSKDGSILKDRFYVIKMAKWPKRFRAS